MLMSDTVPFSLIVSTAMTWPFSTPRRIASRGNDGFSIVEHDTPWRIAGFGGAGGAGGAITFGSGGGVVCTAAITGGGATGGGGTGMSGGGTNGWITFIFGGSMIRLIGGGGGGGGRTSSMIVALSGFLMISIAFEPSPLMSAQMSSTWNR